MERLLKNQQIPLVQVIDPISGQQYYAPESAIYTTSTDSNPVILKNVVVDQSISASYFSGSVLNATSASYASTASYINPLTQNVILTGSLTVSGSSTFTNIGPAIFSGSVTGINGFTGSLQGTASYAIYSANSDRTISSSYAFSSTSASFASTASFINPLNQNVAITGSLTINGNNTITGTTTLGNGTFTKAGFATGDVLLDNNSTDTPGVLFYYANNSNYGLDSWNGSFDVLSGQLVRFTNKLNETGGAVKMAMDTTGNVVFTGFVKANAWRAGQVINDIMLSNTEVTISTTTIATSNTDTDFLRYDYTPLSSTSYLVIHYHLASFSFESGTGNDSYFSRIKVDGNEITYGSQSTVNGFRTGVLFPLTGRYTNSSTATKTIVVAARRNSADDNITIVNTSTSMWLRITEIAR